MISPWSFFVAVLSIDLVVGVFFNFCLPLLALFRPPSVDADDSLAENTDAAAAAAAAAAAEEPHGSVDTDDWSDENTDVAAASEWLHGPFYSDYSSDENTDADADAEEPHGVDPAFMKIMPVTVYSAAEENGGEEEEAMECVICLSKVEEGEEVRLLPACRHGFHVGCIDAWFSSHATCPVCRSPVRAIDGVKQV